MATFFMFGKYSAAALKGIGPGRTEQTKVLIKEHGGELKAGYAVAGGLDIILIVELPDNARAMAVSAALTRLTGVAFTTSPAVTLEEFDKEEV
jgi:uncharacterized protein with GYD domain